MESNVSLPATSRFPQDRGSDGLNVSTPTQASGGEGGFLGQISGNPFFTAVGHDRPVFVQLLNCNRVWV